MRRKSALLAAVSAFAFAAAMSFSAQSEPYNPYCESCSSKCQFTYNRCIANGVNEEDCLEQLRLCIERCGCN